MSLVLENVQVVHGSFSLAANLSLQARVTGFFGRSGAGKTTLLDVIAGLCKPRSGRVIFKDQAWSGNGHAWVPPEKRGIGYVTQGGALFPHMDVRQNLEFGFRRRGESGEFDRVVELMELRPLLGRAVTQLSGGEKQRVAIGRALLASPSLLLLDEPVSSLQHQFRKTFMEFLKQLCQQVQLPIILVSHDPDELVELCEEIVVIDNGSIIAQGPPMENFEATATPTYRLRMPTR